jgi:hypothetical protein
MCTGDRRREESEPAPPPVGSLQRRNGLRSSRPTSRQAPAGQAGQAGQAGGKQSSQGNPSTAAGHGGSSGGVVSGVNRPPKRPQRTDNLMSEQILDGFLEALHRGFQGLEYGVIGGAAIIKHGHQRQTSDIDVIIPEEVSKVAESQLLHANVGIVKTNREQLG